MDHIKRREEEEDEEDKEDVFFEEGVVVLFVVVFGWWWWWAFCEKKTHNRWFKREKVVRRLVESAMGPTETETRSARERGGERYTV